MAEQKRKLDADPDYQQFWLRYQQISSLMERGLLLPARRELTALRRHPRRVTFDPDRHIDYSYAVLLQEIPIDIDDVTASSEILQSILRDAGQKRVQTNEMLVLVELSSAMILLHRFGQAEHFAKEALGQSKEHKARALVFQNLGRAYFEQGKLAEAQTAYLQMIDSSLEQRDITKAGIGAEWLGRIALRNARSEEAATWHDLARDAYRTAAPRHLKSLQDLSDAIGSDTPRRQVSLLGPQAIAIRKWFPEPEEVGDRAGIHLDSLYLDLGALRIMTDIREGNDIEVAIPFFLLDPGICHKFSELIMSEARAILPHAWQMDVIRRVTRSLWPDISEAILNRLKIDDPGRWRFEEVPSKNGEFQLVWRSLGAGPAAFGSELRVLSLLLQAAYKSRLEGLSALPENMKERMKFINLSSRAWPRPIQTWMIAHGQAAAGGEMGPPFLAEDSTRHRTLNAEDNREAFARMGFTPEETPILQRGGLVALLATEVALPGGPPPSFIGTTPVNEVSAANPPVTPLPPNDLSRPGFAIDREYNTVFFAPSFKGKDIAWYGLKNSLFRDHFADFHQQVEIVGSLRAKHFAIPVVEIKDHAELTRVSNLLDEAASRLRVSNHVQRDARIWFRGQNRGYRLNRPEAINRYFFGSPSVNEPSLPGAAPRRGWNYLKVHSFLSTMLQARLYREWTERGEPFEKTYAAWKEFSANPKSWDLGVMLLAQHYGIPTHGIDITSDPDVALWFATNTFTMNEDRTAVYRRLDARDWNPEPALRPLIYAILPVTHSLRGAIQDVDLLSPLKIEALRPRRQSAAFFMGAHGLHRNRLAEALVCILQLTPGQWATKSSYETLFPSAQEDLTYAWITELKSHYTSGEIGKFLNEVPIYAH